ncbi:MAG TPA: class I SAM-dependent methyltransferase, partial [Chthoniobacterales bacterium]|nr:class I SAM-dependent methyltransferase [Chthoniobacterales bacterium]
TRSAATIAYHSSVNRTWGLVLHLCAREFKAAAILELGSCAGISGSYLALAPACRRLVTIEASAMLASLAEHNLSRVSQRAEVHRGFVEDVLPRVLPTFENGVDLAFIDARHEREATLGYWRVLRPRLNEGGLVIFDDIRWSHGMWQAWNTVRRQAGLSCTLDLGRFGVCLCDSSATTADYYNFAVYAGWLRVHRQDRSS